MIHKVLHDLTLLTSPPVPYHPLFSTTFQSPCPPLDSSNGPSALLFGGLCTGSSLSPPSPSVTGFYSSIWAQSKGHFLSEVFPGISIQVGPLSYTLIQHFLCFCHSTFAFINIPFCYWTYKGIYICKCSPGRAASCKARNVCLYVCCSLLHPNMQPSPGHCGNAGVCLTRLSHKILQSPSYSLGPLIVGQIQQPCCENAQAAQRRVPIVRTFKHPIKTSMCLETVASCKRPALACQAYKQASLGHVCRHLQYQLTSWQQLRERSWIRNP